MPNASSPRGFWLVILSAALIWSVGVTRPVDLPNWHESDYASLARNFLREGGNILYPRIDWRADGPGYTEMEFPVVPWLAAQVYRFTGVSDTVTRVISLVSMLGGLFFFLKLAGRFLPDMAANAAGLFYIFNHVAAMVASAHQPEALMQALMMASLYYFVDWQQSGAARSYVFSLLSFSGAMLLKLPMAHLGLLFFLYALQRKGASALRQLSLYLFGILAAIPPLLWYMHAATFWRIFHNSSGISDQYHWIGLDLLKRPKVILNFFGIEVLLAGALGGALVALIVAYRGRLRSPAARLALPWLLTVAIYFTVILRTSAAYWAVYYHLVVVAPLALLFGSGIAAVRAGRRPSLKALLTISASTALLFTAAFTFARHLRVQRLPGIFQDLLVSSPTLPTLLGLTGVALLLTLFCFRLQGVDEGPQIAMTGLAAPLVIAGCFVYFFISGQLLLGLWKQYRTRSPEFLSAQILASKVPPGVRVVASGGVCFDPGGFPTASKASDVFYWLDVKGFSTCEGEESIEQIHSYTARGAQYFIAEKGSLLLEPEFDKQLSKSFPLLIDTSTSKLYRLEPSKVLPVP